METIEKTYRAERQSWGEGPWLSEPDKIQFEDSDTKLPCLIVRGPLGNLCGYVGVAAAHPFFGVDPMVCSKGCDEQLCDHRPENLLSAHGGVNFGSFCRDDDKEQGVCHIPGPGEPDRVWWLGFDCAHVGDLVPGLHLGSLFGETFLQDTYKDVPYVKSECAELAAQLSRLGAAG